MIENAEENTGYGDGNLTETEVEKENRVGLKAMN